MFDRLVPDSGHPRRSSPLFRLSELARGGSGLLTDTASPPPDEHDDLVPEVDPPPDRAKPEPPVGRLVERWVPSPLTGARGGSPRRRRWAVVAAVLCVVTAVVATVLLGGGAPAMESPPRLPPAKPVAAGTSTHPSTSASTAALVVSVVGKVAKPGLVTVPAGSRVADALRAAGGPASGANLLTVNLARRLVDGEQVAVGVPAPAGVTAQRGVGAPDAKLDLNTAGLDQLDTLPGVGEVTAQRIVDWRTQHGRFGTVEQLRDVDGIGESKFEKLRDKVTVA